MELRKSDDRSVSTLPWHEAARRLSSPEDISKSVKNRVKYSRDMFIEDEWRSGRDTWDRGKGDCEDFAAVVKDLCSENGFKAEIISVRSETARAAHAVTMGEVNGRIWVSSNGSYKEYQSRFDAREDLARDLGWWAPETEMLTVKQSRDGKRSFYVTMPAYNGHSDSLFGATLHNLRTPYRRCPVNC